jgi:hypothetical protein
MVRFTSRPLYHRCTGPQYPLDRRLDGLQNRYGRGGDEENSLSWRKLNPGRSYCSLLSILTELSRLLSKNSIRLKSQTDLCDFGKLG